MIYEQHNCCREFYACIGDIKQIKHLRKAVKKMANNFGITLGKIHAKSENRRRALHGFELSSRCFAGSR
jgi:hypothetical protein